MLTGRAWLVLGKPPRERITPSSEEFQAYTLFGFVMFFAFVGVCVRAASGKHTGSACVQTGPRQYSRAVASGLCDSLGSHRLLRARARVYTAPVA